MTFSGATITSENIDQNYPNNKMRRIKKVKVEIKQFQN